jgi:hypothetical protein
MNSMIASLDGDDLQTALASSPHQPLFGISLKIERQVVQWIKKRHGYPCTPCWPQHTFYFCHNSHWMRYVFQNLQARNAIETLVRKR